MSYHAYMLAPRDAVQQVANPFEDFDVPAFPHGPCLTITVTEEMRQMDAVLQRIQGEPTAWEEFKKTLNVANMRTVKPKVVKAGRKVETRIFAAPRETKKKKAARSGRYCGCGKELSRPTLGTRCNPCYIVYRREMRAERDAEMKALGLRGSHSEIGMPRVACNTCPNLLRAGRAFGICHDCQKKRPTHRTNYYRTVKKLEAQNKCPGCDVLICADSKACALCSPRLRRVK